MINGKTVLAIIPARGGSKGVPRKNVKDLCGKPLIAWTIEEALKSKYIDRLIVSTEDDEIAEISKKYGAEVPFVRPKELAEDTSKAIDTYIYTVNKLRYDFKYRPDIILILQATSPFRKTKHIDEALNLFINKQADSVISVMEIDNYPEWLKKITQEGKLIDYIDSTKNYLNRQEIDEYYVPNGAIYIFKTEIITNLKTYYTDDTYAYIMQKEESIDIDTKFDFKIAQLILKETM